jgi:hypothetical protein
MFPIAHLWLLERVVPQPAQAHYLGCVWPDMLFGSPLTHHDSHQRGTELLAFARARAATSAPEASELLAFVAGAVSHGSAPRGFDWYSDECYGGEPESARGYAFQRARPLAAATATACRLPPEMGWWKAHNLVEMACELPLFTADPALADRFIAACDNAGLVERMTRALAAFYGQPADALAASVRTFSDVWAPPTSTETLARVYARQLQLKHGVNDPDESALAALIARAAALVAPDRDAYLAYCAHQVRDLFDDLALR